MPLLLMMTAQATGLELRHFVHRLGDAHLYLNHHLTRRACSSPRSTRACRRWCFQSRVKDLFGFTYDDFTPRGYDPPPPLIKATVSCTGPT